jgi:hypothetical protein
MDYTEELLLELIERHDENEEFYREKLTELQAGGTAYMMFGAYAHGVVKEAVKLRAAGNEKATEAVFILLERAIKEFGLPD